ncbi:DUF2711 family protein [Pedobacter foliorum]|uniref:DUF2711 family protein n=1 Tax=Pedobacter foliorum TaxID=2739058 RepID=UPI0015659890|nr:DUF2711 family protein [Pedobacter foliorum]NRF41408.1 DUF2711 family protein [Pedobacter foliorum]
MTDKPPFEAPHNCICAYADVSILEFYRGCFDSVYIMLHPFYKLDKDNKIIQVTTWKDFQSLAGFENINQLDVALRTNVGGLRIEYENKKDADILRQASELHNLWIPSEGNFQDTLDKEMLRSLQGQGHQYMYIGDEWGFERKLSYIQDVVDGKDDTLLTWGPQKNWYTTHNEILYATHWDSHFTLLCSNKNTVENILFNHRFEGFYCDEKIDIYWSTK